MAELSITEVFLILKPLCDSFMNEPTVNKVEELGILVKRTSSTLIQTIHENILYPITFHLKSNTLKKDQNIKLIETIRIVVLKSRIQNEKLFYEIYHCLRMQICQEKNLMELIDVHEELKEIVVQCLKDLIKNSSISIIESFYTQQRAALLSHGVYLCVKIARLEKSSGLRIAAIETVMTLMQIHEEADSQDVVLRHQIADVITSYLPGVVSGLLEVALGSDIQNHKITMLAIRAWSRVTMFVMQDIPPEESTAEPITLMIENIVNSKYDSKNLKNVLDSAKRTPKWYLAVSEKFKIIFTELDTLTKHSHFKVRSELAEGISLMLLSCSRNMKPCFQTLLDILITLSEDENSQVAEKGREGLQKIQEKCLQDKNMKSVIEVLEENLYDLLTKMPRIIRTSDDALQLVWLNRLAGYLKVLGKKRLSGILLSTAHLQKLLLTLVYISELNCNDVSLLEDVTTINFDETAYYEYSRSWKRYKFLFDSKSMEKLNSIFVIIGEFGDHQTLVDSILKMTLDVPKLKKELTLVLNHILQVPSDPAIQMSISRQVVDHYIDADYWNLPIKVSDEVTLQTAQNNIIQCGLLLEGLGIIAKVLKEDFQCFLLKTLFLIIERAGSEHSLLRFIGISTLEIIAKSQNLDAIGDLFRVNVDYISYHVTVKLRRVERNPGVLDVVSVVTNYSSIDFLPHLKDVVDDVLLQSSSNVQKRNTGPFLKVFHAFVICIKRLTAKNVKMNETFYEDYKNLNPANVVIDNFLEYYNAEKNSKAFENDEEADSKFNEILFNSLENESKAVSVEENCNYDAKEDENEEKAPYYINMVKDIMKRCLHFLPSQDFTESSLAMLTLKEGSFILQEWENELLPIVHELWHPLVDRFQSHNPLVINQAWQLLCCLAQVSKDFIRSRTLKKILPPLSSFLKKSAKESFRKDSKSTYQFTQIFKLQKTILIQLGSLVRNLKLLERDTWNILDITEPYLDSLQNLQLQEYCVNMYKEIYEYNPDIVWIKCVDIWNRNVESVVPANNLNAWYMKIVQEDVKSNYQENVLQILNFMYSKSEIL